jgi:hypothetical protein
MEQTVEGFLGAVVRLLTWALVVGLLAVLLVAEGYYLVGFWSRLYWRCRETLRQARRER